MNLRDYQISLKNGLYQSWQSGNDNVTLVSPTGSGKTVTMASICQDQTGPGVTIAHRTELVSQISLTLARFGIYHSIIGSSSTIKFCIQQHIIELGRKFYDTNAPVTVASVDTLNSRADSLSQFFGQQRWWMIDECFVAGTMIGNKPIEDVEVGDVVDAFDERAGRLVRAKVTRVFANPMPPDGVVKVATPHHVLYTTKGHPFWTQRGWVCAKDLTVEDTLYSDTLHVLRNTHFESGRSAALQIPQNGSNFLQSVVRSIAQRFEPKTTGGRTDCDGLPHLRQIGETQTKPDASVSPEQPRVLQQRMLQGASVESLVSNNGANQSEARIGAYEAQQSNVQTRSRGEGFKTTQGDWSSTKSAWWQWETTDESGTSIDVAARMQGLCGTTRRPNGLSERNWSRALQDRLCEPPSHDRNRSGWFKSWGDSPQRVGCAQGSFLAKQRVVGISFLKRDDPSIPGDGFVYNIEVDAYHTYTANGIVVHNCHHVLQGNKWGKAASRLPNARGVGFTATPIRADRKSLHADQGGVFHDMVLGPTMRDLINNGHLCDYRIFAPPQSINLENVKIGSTGDYSQPGLREAAHKSQIVGDVVNSYQKFAAGMRGITFVVDVEQAVATAAAFNEAGVTAMAVSAKTSDTVRAAAVRKFRDGSVQQLVNVDLFGEGFDVPAVEVVSMARPTMSYGLFVQQFGRALRPLDGKSHGLIIDHVGNVVRHGLPDAPRKWRLWNEEGGKRRRADDDVVIPVTTCTECFSAYERIHKACPFCGHVPVPAGRSLPEQVDGDLVELDETVLAKMRGEVDRLDAEPQIPLGATDVVEASVRKNWHRRQEAQRALRDAMAIWGGMRHEAGDSDSEMQRRFYHQFGVDVLTAQSLGRAEAEKLTKRIMET